MCGFENPGFALKADEHDEIMRYERDEALRQLRIMRGLLNECVVTLRWHASEGRPAFPGLLERIERVLSDCGRNAE